MGGATPVLLGWYASQLTRVASGCTLSPPRTPSPTAPQHPTPQKPSLADGEPSWTLVLNPRN